MEDEVIGIRRVLFAALLGLAVCDPALAELDGIAAGDPAFTANDREIISRNETLRNLLDGNPRLVRRVLDELARLPPASRLPATPANPDPDLDRLRSSPEGQNDLFQVLKAAGDKKKKN